MNTAAVLPLELFEPGEYLNQTGPGYFATLAKPNGRVRQDLYELKYLPFVIDSLDPTADQWISQATFTRKTRRATNVQSVGLLFADLDTYNVPGLARRSPGELANLLVAYCAENGIPAPSIIMFSGRGLQAKWLLTEALTAASLIDWNAVQLELVRRLEDFGSDRNARDVSRVLRVDRTVNTKSGEVCRVVYVHSGVEAVPTRYDFDEMREIFPTTEPTRSARPSTPGKILTFNEAMSLKRLNWYRLYDIRDLWKMRGGVKVGHRETTLFWELNFLMRAEPCRVQDFWKECEALASEIDDSSGWYAKSDVSTVYRKAQELYRGNGTEYRGKRFPPLYTPRNATLAEIFQITPEEEKSLRTIISLPEKRRRETEKRRAQGVIARAEYEGKALTTTRPWEELRVSRATWYRLQGRAE